MELRHVVEWIVLTTTLLAVSEYEDDFLVFGLHSFMIQSMEKCNHVYGPLSLQAICEYGIDFLVLELHSFMIKNSEKINELSISSIFPAQQECQSVNSQPG